MRIDLMTWIKGEKNISRIRPIPLALYLMLTLSLNACKKDDTGFNTTHPPASTDPVQYGEPFGGVPSAKDVVMYEVNIQAFSAAGDLNGVRNRLTALKELGVNVVWLMPINTPGILKSVGSPYAIKDYKGINSKFGNLDDLRLLVKEAHDLNMAVILDWVANHTSWDHPWIQNPAWYVRDNSGQIVSPNGWTDVAELNFDNTSMRREMISAMKYWMLTANVDGYRCDHVDGVPADFWKQAIDTLRKLPNRKVLMFAESSDKKMFTPGFDLVFGWDFYGKLKGVFNDNLPVSDLVTANASDNLNVPAGKRVLRWTSNHDDNAWDNTPVQIFKGNEGSMTAYAITLLMGGSPLLYNGQEVGCPDKLSFFSGSVNKINWGLNPDMLAQYQKLHAIRHSSNAVKEGTVQSYGGSNHVLVFKRVLGGEQVLVMANVRNTPQTYSLPAELANTLWVDAMTGLDAQLGNEVALSAFQYRVLKAK